MNEIIERKSVRAYTNKAVSDEDIYEMVECARQAPSGDNTQPWRFIVIRNQEVKEKIAKISNNQKWMLDAPVFIVCLLDGSARLDDESLKFDETSSEFELKQMIRDTSIAIEHLVLKAQNLGLGSCWTAWFEQQSIKEVLDLPSNTFVVAVVSVGYSKYSSQVKRTKKNIEEIMFFEKYKNNEKR